MKLENITGKIRLARESRARFLFPIEDFLYKINSAGALVDFTEEQKATKDVRQDARKYFVIACVSGMETYFKRTAQVFIDAKWVKEELFDLFKQDKISLADLREINKKQISLGEIIAVSYSFQDLESINRFCSKMFAVTDFIREFETRKVATEEGKSFTISNDYPHFRERIVELVRLRHLIIHHEGFKGILGVSRLFDMGKSLVYFVLAADDYILEKVPVD
jgi:hypothetical protein